MNANAVNIFMYGLFMDESLLNSLGVHPTQATVGHVEGFDLHIGKRATLLPAANSRAYGVLMKITAAEVATLYADESLADYVAEPVAVTLPGGTRVAAVCYILPATKLAGTNSEYAAALLASATRLGFPEGYLERIRHAAAGPGVGGAS